MQRLSYTSEHVLMIWTLLGIQERRWKFHFLFVLYYSYPSSIHKLHYIYDLLHYFSIWDYILLFQIYFKFRSWKSLYQFILLFSTYQRKLFNGKQRSLII
jgi:hypothetical protein